jgi:hypothetical protein
MLALALRAARRIPVRISAPSCCPRCPPGRRGSSEAALVRWCASPVARASGATGSKRRAVRSRVARSTTSCSTTSPKSRCRSCRSRRSAIPHGLRARLHRRDGKCVSRRRERGVKVIANAGGVNPAGVRRSGARPADKHGVRGKLRIGVVTGDDMLPRSTRCSPRATSSSTWTRASRSRTFATACSPPMRTSARRPSSKRCGRGANVVITGRSTDTALTMAPLRHEFGWADDDWDRLAAGIVAGHILECGAQCVGGNCLHDWRTIPDLANVGYPIAEARPTARSSSRSIRAPAVASACRA